ncbi:MAG TPA: helix-turn-helix transcriptional regulator [Pyrinomonadaceae bacterium]|jgi:DNA-binding CsgD family transcriptional regulator
MITRLLEREDDCLTGRAAPDTTMNILRSLISQVVNPTDPDQSDVLLDTEVDGVRCLLVRLHPRHAGAPVIILSPREQEIARMVAAGYPNKTIAAVLEISSWTVGTHLRRVFAKLGVGSRAAMVARLLEDSLLTQSHRPAEQLTHGGK